MYQVPATLWNQIAITQSALIKNKVLKMAMQNESGELDVWLDRQSTDLMREEEVSETVALAYQKMMVLVSSERRYKRIWWSRRAWSWSK